MLLLIPHLFPPPRLLETAVQDLRLPAFETLLARGTRQACSDQGVEAALCEALGISRQQDWPLAPISLEADGKMAEGTYWLRADPVHLRVMRDRIVLTNSVELNVSREEAEELAAAIGQHFGDALRPVPLHPQRWYVPTLNAPNLTTTPPSIAIGRAIEPMLPQGDDSAQVRSQLNELQMLLFAHPINQARESRGELPINSLWLWGGGHKPVVPVTAIPVYAHSHEAQALASLCRAPVHALPEQFQKTLAEMESIVLLEDLTSAGQCGDAYGWRETIRLLESNWFIPLLDHLSNVAPQGLQILDPIHGRALQLNRWDVWKVWRRRQRLGTMQF